MASTFPLTAWRVRLASPGKRAALVVLSGAVLALALAGASRLIAQIEGDRGIPPIATSKDITVSGIKVDVTADTGQEAQAKGWRLAEQLAWQKLHGPKMSDDQIDAMVSTIIIESEQTGPRRYIAQLGVVFDRTKAGQFIGGGAGSAIPRSAPLLVLPILYSGGVAQVFEVRGAWQRAWAQFQPADSPIDYVRPSGSGGESLILTAGQATRRSRQWWRAVLDQFEAADVLIPIARLERQWPGGPVRGTFTARYGPDDKFLSSFQLTANDDSGVPAMLAQAVERIDGIYRDALASGLLKPDTSLTGADSALNAALSQIASHLSASEPASEETGAPVATASEGAVPAPGQMAPATYSVQFVSPNAAAVDAALNAVRGVAGVRSAATTSIAIGGTSVMRVSFAGTLDTLAAALRSQGWQVSAGKSALRISR